MEKLRGLCIFSYNIIFEYLAQSNTYNPSIFFTSIILFDVRLLKLIETIQKQTKKRGSNVIVQAGQLHARLLEHRLVQPGFKLCSRHGNVENLTVKEIEKSMNGGLMGVDSLIINCFTKACTNDNRGLWAIIKKWLGYE